MRIIAFEGIDACGKSTQASLLTNYLQGQGYKVKFESFPRYDTNIGLMIKDALETGNVDEKTLQLLFEADKQDFQNEIKEAEEAGIDFIILDRYTLSGLVYGIANRLDLDWLGNLQKYLKYPDIVFYIDVDVEESFNRRAERRDLYETNKEFLDKVRSLYRVVYLKVTEVVYIDGQRKEEEVFQGILSRLVEEEYLWRK